MKRSIIFILLSITGIGYAQTGNVGIGTSTPGTKLDVNGAITNRETELAIAGNAATIPANTSQAQLVGVASATITITAPAAPNAGQRLIIYNNTVGGFGAVLNGFTISNGQAVEFTYSGNNWRATNNGVANDYDWMKTGNQLPTDPADTVQNIYHIGGSVGIGRNNPLYTLHVHAVADQNITAANNIVARFDPLGGSNVNKPAAIVVNGGRAAFGYDTNSVTGKYVYLRGNESTDIRLQTMNASAVLQPEALVISSLGGSTGFVGINTSAPRTRLEVNGALTVGAGPAPNSINMTYISFNSLRPGIGETEFVNYHGTGTGGFRFYTIPNSGTPAYPTHAAAFIAANGQYFQTSDRRVKSNISTVTGALRTVLALRPVTYDMHIGKSGNDNAVKSIGFIAQEVYNVIPEAVDKPNNEANGMYAVSYTAIVPVLTKAIQEQQALIEAQNKRIAELEKLVADIIRK